MPFHTASRRHARAYDHRPLSFDARPQRILAGAALAGVASLCAWTLYASLAGAVPESAEIAAAMRADKLADAVAPAEIAATRGDKLAIATPRPAPEANTYAWLFDPRAFGAPQKFSGAPAQQVASVETPPPPPQPVQQAESVPLPPPLDIHITPSVRTAALRESARLARLAAAAAKIETAKIETAPTLFEKLFGKPSPPPTLAYASADDQSATNQNLANIGGRFDHWTAVYDITAHKVYLPDGRALEAHSGYGANLDNPNSAAVKDRGVTPPDLYDLQPREASFHGVAALRLIPVEDDKVFGRSGLLAHSYMLGPNGDSNGCVSFKDYEAFRAAYSSGEIKRLAVVSSLD
jgi:hypothetical protein